MLKAPRGTKDILGKEIYLWHELENKIKEVCLKFGVEEIRTPIFEQTELYQRGVGETTDIVQKEMYTLENKSDKSLTLKPEGTAGVARAFIEHKLYANVQPTKLYYIAPHFRYERPQAGRYRQFHQFGVEMFGSYSSASDAEVISLGHHLLQELGLNVELKINSLGGSECRTNYNKLLSEFLEVHADNLCELCKQRMVKNPLRVLDCKSDGCKEIMKNAPSIIDSLGDECRAHFEQLQEFLTDMDIPFTVDEKIVRGLDYYTGAVFEFVTNDLGSQSAVCGGGRYNSLIKQCGGPDIGAVGFAMGMERLVLLMDKKSEDFIAVPERDIFIGSAGEKGFKMSQAIVYELRKIGFKAETDTLQRSVKAQMKYANKINAKYSAIIGDDEIQNNTVKLKNMLNGEEKEVIISDIKNYIS